LQRFDMTLQRSRIMRLNHRAGRRGGAAGLQRRLAQVTVTYVKPEDFTDVPRNPIDRERTLKDFSDYFKSLEKKLPAGQSLKIEVLDIDLAGRLYPRRGGDDIRIMNGGADWPHMHLKYTLEQDGQSCAAATSSCRT
jgi:hypothetical protein